MIFFTFFSFLIKVLETAATEIGMSRFDPRFFDFKTTLTKEENSGLSLHRSRTEARKVRSRFSLAPALGRESEKEKVRKAMRDSWGGERVSERK